MQRCMLRKDLMKSLLKFEKHQLIKQWYCPWLRYSNLRQRDRSKPDYQFQRKLWEALETTGENINQLVKRQDCISCQNSLLSKAESEQLRILDYPYEEIITVTKRVEQIWNLNPPNKRKGLRQFKRRFNYLRDILVSKVSYLWSIKRTKLCVLCLGNGQRNIS
jgi:hypothetical protein